MKPKQALGHLSCCLVLLVGVTSVASWDPMTAEAVRVKTFRASVGPDGGDYKAVHYSAVAATHDGNTVVLVDDRNKAVKLVRLSGGNIESVTSKRLYMDLYDVSLLEDGLFAVSGYDGHWGRIVLLRADGDVLREAGRARGWGDYVGVTQGPDWNPSSMAVTQENKVEIISRKGNPITAMELPAGTEPRYLTADGENGFIASDAGTGKLYRVISPVLLPRLEETIEVPGENPSPQQIAVDHASGAVYVAAQGTGQVLVRSAEGTWRTLLEGKGGAKPKGIALTDHGIVVAWTMPDGSSKVRVYNLTGEVVDKRWWQMEE